MKRQFPYVPKSNKGLEPGDYWAVPLSDGTYAAGRVLEIARDGQSGTRTFLGGLMDWHGTGLPEQQNLAARQVLDRGVMHLLAITQTGGAILGNRPLAQDGIVPEYNVSATMGGVLMLGLSEQRPATAEEGRTLPTLRTWGFGFIAARAERLFVVAGPV